MTLPKKTSTTQCDDYQMISFMSHVTKVFLSIIHIRYIHRLVLEIFWEHGKLYFLLNDIV